MMEKLVLNNSKQICKALLEDEDEEIEIISSDDEIVEFEVSGQTYLFVTDEQADELANSYIEGSLWAFRPEFLASETLLPEEVFESLQNKCENANEPINSLIKKTCGLDTFIQSAIDADGRGFFISSYDGEEHEIKLENKWYYMYRKD
jgi:hypothetical protein